MNPLRDIKSFFLNWKTTAAGIAMILGVLLIPLTDGDPNTHVHVGNDQLLAILAGIGLIFARDSNKSSQDSDIRP